MVETIPSQGLSPQGGAKRVIPMQAGQHVDLFTLWCQASRGAVGMMGWTFPHLELCFPVLWLFESITRQCSEKICELAAWSVTKKVSLIIIALSSSTDLKKPREWQNKRRQKQDGTEGLLTRDAD